jgi:cystathionine gamma-synthase
VLLSNSNDFLERTAVLNSNAAALAACFAAEAADPASPVKAVHYPPHTKGTSYLQEFLRAKTPELPEPGYGCLLSVELRSLDQTIAFYDNLRFHHGPHLGAHRTLAVPYNILTYSKEHPEYHKGYGLTHEQIRLSVGLEDTETLLATVRAALDKAREVPAAAADKAAAVEEKVANDGDIKTGFDPLAGKAN